MKTVLPCLLLLFSVVGCQSVELIPVEELQDAETMWDCHVASAWDHAKVSSLLVGTWQGRYQDCPWGDLLQESSEDITVVNLIFTSDGAFVVEEDGSEIFSAEWVLEVVQGNSFYLLTDKPGWDLGPLYICDRVILDHGTPFDGCDTYYQKISN
ncbi:MAG TPA: hypothetical protein DCP28_12510 [Cytophagales bacterium]|nr:hypothetical protein [Cytophagales bacterium]